MEYMRYQTIGAWLSLLVLTGACEPRARDGRGGRPGRLPEEPQQPTPFLADVESRVVTSVISGREFQISIALPLGYADTLASYPVLYALDANGQFGTMVEAARLLRLGEQIPALLMVGVGYPSGGRQIHARTHRLYDLFPTVNRDWEEAEARASPDLPPPEGSGGGPAFLRFLREELIPLIETEYRADAGNRALYGHSAGGLFALYALLRGEGTFRRMIIGSPSLWWDDRYIFQLEGEYFESSDSLPARVFLSVGLDENDQLDEGGWGRMVSNFRDLVDLLGRRGYEGLEWQHHFFEGENHTSVVPATISRGLRFIYHEASQSGANGR